MIARPAIDSIDERQGCRSATRWAAGPITWAGSKLNSRPVRRLKSLGLRPSAFVDVGSVWNLTKPDLVNFPGRPAPEPRTRRDADPLPGSRPPVSRLPGSTHARPPASPMIRQSGFKEFFLRQFGQAAPFGRHRRQLGVAIRSAAYRYRQSSAHAGRRRNQTVLIQRRNPILMKNSSCCRPHCGFCPCYSGLAQRVPAARSQSSTSTGSAANAMPARRPRPAAVAGHRLQHRRQQLATQLQPEGQQLQTAVTA